MEENGFRFGIDGEKAEITGYEGRDIRIEVPRQAGGYPVSSIARKAFLGKRDLYAVTLPESVEEIGDWAFANCSGLAEVSFPKREIRFGRSVFKNCGNLKRIAVRKCGQKEDARGKENRKEAASGKAVPEEYGLEEKDAPGDGNEAHCEEPELLAATVTLLDAYYLLDPETAGSAEWLDRWDHKLLSVLHTSDQEGYISQSVYGEEDYIGTDLEEYISERRKEKVRLAFLRLLHSRRLAPALRGELEELLRRFAGGRGGGETWQVLFGEHADEREYYRLFAELSCINEENFDGILGDIGEGHPEMKAYFLKCWEERHTAEDFFQGLEL